MNYIRRTIQSQIENQFGKGKVLIIYGARRTGKTTLVKQILADRPEGRYINCDLLQYKSALETTNSELLKDFIGNTNLLILDEAQQIYHIGKVLKIISDEFPSVQVIATGSSSFDLRDKLAEPLTGRSRIFQLFPFSFEELHQNFSLIELNARLPNILRFGLYPEVFDLGEKEAIEELQNISSNYLYKDILQLDIIKRPGLVHRLLRALALQSGKEFTLNELAVLLGENVHTVKRYIEILEQSFVIFTLGSYSRNLRKEISKGTKIFFIDPGIRNALIMNFNQLDNRNDTGSLWESFCTIERLKFIRNQRFYRNLYFWRTYDQMEIDLIEECDGGLSAFEFKWNELKKAKVPVGFAQSYPESSFTVINRKNYAAFLTDLSSVNS